MKKLRFLLLAVFVALIASKGSAQSHSGNFMEFFNSVDQNSAVKSAPVEGGASRVMDMKMLPPDSRKKRLKTIGTILTQHFRCRYVKSYSFIYTDKGSGGTFDLGVWRPNCPAGWIRLGDVAVPSMSESQPDVPALLIWWDDNNPAGDEKGPFLAKPVRYEWVWDDRKSGAKRDCSFWRPIPPAGYVAMGFVANSSHANPGDLGIIRCVRSDLVYPAKWVGHIYIDKKTGATYDCAVWSFTVRDDFAKVPFLIPNTFFVHNSYDGTPGTPAWVLKGLGGDDAFKDAQQGYVNVAAKAFVGRIQQAVKNSRQLQQEELNRRISNLSSQADASKKAAADPVLDETIVATDADKNNNLQESAHDLPGIEMTDSQFKDMLKAIEKEGPNLNLARIPALSKLPMVKGLKFENVVLSQGSIAEGNEKDQPWLCIDGNATIEVENAGDISGRVIFLARLFKKTGLMTSVIVTLPTEDFLKKCSDFDKKPLDQIKISDTAFTLANGEHEWLLKEFPEKIQKDLATFASDERTIFPFVAGKGAWLSAEIKEKSFLAAPFSILKTQPPKVMFSATFPQTKNESVKIRARLLSEFDPKFLPIGDFLKFGLPMIEFSLGDFKSLALLIELKLNLTAKLNLNIPLRMDFPLGAKFTSISVTGFLPFKWENAFGIPGFSLSNLGISGSFGKLPSLALSGLFDLGADWKFDLVGALSFTSPIGLSGLSCKLGRDLGLGDLIELHSLLTKIAFPKIPIPDLGTIDLPFLDLKLRDPFFCVSQIEIPALSIREGITCSGTLLLGDTELGGGYFWMLKDKGIQCQAWVKKFGFGPIEISGAGPDKKPGTGDDCPIIDLAYWPLRQPPYTLNQHCYISGNASILTSSFDVFLNLKKDSVDFSLNGNLQNALKLYLFAEGKSELLKDLTKGGSLKCSGEVSGNFDNLEKIIVKPVENLGPVKSAIAFFGDNLLKIKSIKVSGSLEDVSKGLLPEAEITGSIFGFAFSLKEPMDFATGKYIETWTTKISAMIKEQAESFLTNPAEFIGKAAVKVAELGLEVSEELVKSMGRSPEETWKNATQSAQKAGEAAKKVAVESAVIAGNTAKQAADNAEKIGKMVADTMENIAKDAWDTVTGWL